MKLKAAFILLFCLSSQTLFGQGNAGRQIHPSLKDFLFPPTVDSVEYWDLDANINLNIQQIGLLNWTAGGESSIGLGTVLEADANYEKANVVWKNRGRLAYGVLRQGNDAKRFEKTDDNLLLTSTYSQKFSEQILMTSQLLFQTQVDKGFKTEGNERILISDFLSPGYLQASHGLTYRDGDEFDITVSPFSGRFTIVLNDSLANAGAFGVPIGQNIRSEAGFSITGSVKKQLVKNVNFRLTANLFSNYEKFPSTVVNALATLDLRVNKYIGATVSTQVIYDEDVLITFNDGTQGTGVQIKNVINVGFNIGF